MGERGVALHLPVGQLEASPGAAQGRVMDFHKNLLFRGVLHDQTPQVHFDQTPQIEANYFDQTPQVRTSS